VIARIKQLTGRLDSLFSNVQRQPPSPMVTAPAVTPTVGSALIPNNRWLRQWRTPVSKSKRIVSCLRPLEGRGGPWTMEQDARTIEGVAVLGCMNASVAEILPGQQLR
jgi:hypothetical protein